MQVSMTEIQTNEQALDISTYSTPTDRSRLQNAYLLEVYLAASQQAPPVHFLSSNF